MNWFDVWSALDSKDSLSVWDDLKLSGDLLATVAIENYLPNASPASKVIKDKIGSDDGLKFALYVGTIDSQLGSILAAKANLMEKLNTYEDKADNITSFIIPFASASRDPFTRKRTKSERLRYHLILRNRHGLANPK